MRAKPFYFIKIKVNNKRGSGIEVSSDNRRRQIRRLLSKHTIPPYLVEDARLGCHEHLSPRLENRV
jgi:hypothetical protein